MGIEQRASFRVVTQQEGKLRVGKQTYDCSISNESASGFAASVAQPLHFDRGLQLELLKDGGVTIVKVVRCKVNANGTTVGLERVKDLASPKDLAGMGWSLLSYCCGWRRQAEGMTLANIALVCLLVVAGGWGMIRIAYAVMPRADRGAATSTAFGNVSATYVVESRRNLAQSFDDYLERFRSNRPGSGAAGSDKVEQNFARFVRQRLLASNQAAIALGLSKDQIEQVRAAVCAVESEVASLSKSLKADEAELASVAQTRLEAAEQESLACLTHDQRLLWATLTDLELADGTKKN